ncbi:MAG TPA: TROVE domain-containing protein [Chitinophagales bacterium]|nr:TROVE domain-containing protein [Chitinophagales bacterium]
MARFNFSLFRKRTVNPAGGEAYAQTPELELVSILLTSFANDQFYRAAPDTFARLKELVALCDKQFVAKAAVYARKEFGMRSITHVVASELAKHVNGEPWAKDFYAAVVHRPDDMMEILAYHASTNGKVTNPMKKGFAKAFDRFDAYALAKYRGIAKAFKLVDVVNLVHPKPTSRNAEAINALVKDELRSFDTWETALTKAGQVATSENEKAELKKEAWEQLVGERKIGYFALLRNLRNIVLQSPNVLDEALALLVDERMIRKSLVLPFRFLTAYDELQKATNGAGVSKVLAALSDAVDIAVKNVPVLEGDTLVVLDVSGSMAGRPAQIGSLLAATLIKSNDADFMVFSDSAAYKNVNRRDSTLTIAQSVRFAQGGTNFHAIFQKAKRRYDRIVILSDMQGWIGHDTPKSDYNKYKSRYDADPVVYSFDLQGYGTLQLPERNVYCLAGFSDKVFDVMKLLETDKNALVTKIQEVQFN